MSLHIPLPAGYRPDWVLAYHGRDRESPSERVEGHSILKRVEVEGRVLALTIRIGQDRAVVDGAPAEHAAGAEVTARRMLGLLHDPAGLEQRADGNPAIARIVGSHRGLRFPLTATVFEALCWAIVGQQVNLTFAATLRRTVIGLAGLRDEAGTGIAHPTAERVARLNPDQLTARKFSRSKADYLLGAARHIADGRLDLESLPGLDARAAEAALTGIRGIGPWTRQYVLMRGCGLPDCAPVGDAGLAAALQRLHGMDRRPTPAEQAAMMAGFAPYRSHATACLWASLYA